MTYWWQNHSTWPLATLIVCLTNLGSSIRWELMRQRTQLSSWLKELGFRANNNWKGVLLQMILGRDDDHLVGVDVNNDNKKAGSPFISSWIGHHSVMITPPQSSQTISVGLIPHQINQFSTDKLLSGSKIYHHLNHSSHKIEDFLTNGIPKQSQSRSLFCCFLCCWVNTWVQFEYLVLSLHRKFQHQLLRWCLCQA